MHEVGHTSHAAHGLWGYLWAAGAIGASWAQSNAAGALVTTITVIVGGGVAAYCLVVEKLKASAERRWLAHEMAEHQARLDLARVAAEIRVLEAHAELQIKAEQEQANRDSIAGQLAHLQATADQSLQRANDLNAKLHEQRKVAQAVQTRLDDALDKLGDATEELAAVRNELSRERTANNLLTERIEQLEGKVDTNAETLATLAATSAEFPAQPPAPEPKP